MAKTWDMQAIKSRWVAGMGSARAQQKYKEGIMALTVSPTQKAASPEAEAKYLSGVQNSVTSGKRKARLMEISLAEYQQLATTKGAAHLMTGAQAGQGRYEKGMAKYPAVWAQIQSELSGMEKGGLANALARSQAAITALMKAAGRA